MKKYCQKADFNEMEKGTRHYITIIVHIHYKEKTNCIGKKIPNLAIGRFNDTVSQ